MPSFEDRRLATADQVELHRIDVDTDHPVSIAREARQRHRADIAQAEDADALGDRRRAGRLLAGVGTVLVRRASTARSGEPVRQ